MPDEPALQFLDTHFLVYAHDISVKEKYVRAKSLLLNLWETGRGCLSVQVLQEFYVAITQKVPRSIDAQTASDIIRALSNWVTHTPTTADVLGAIELQQRDQIPFWNARILYSASKLGSQTLWSEDLTLGQVYDGVQVVNPFIAPK